MAALGHPGDPLSLEEITKAQDLAELRSFKCAGICEGSRTEQRGWTGAVLKPRAAFSILMKQNN